jgi:hypothetical protein
MCWLASLLGGVGTAGVGSLRGDGLIHQRECVDSSQNLHVYGKRIIPHRPAMI